MNDEELYRYGGFSPSWIEETPSTSKAYKYQTKNLDVLLEELEEIKLHLQDVQARQWQLGKLLQFVQHNIAKE